MDTGLLLYQYKNLVLSRNEPVNTCSLDTGLESDCYI